ncbi:hypothetical protein [Stenotrophomonas maltophilia]|uniref:hypothetical protein n=1 Tax=Stenotrophomonas maltophilia TaxID=40324 RepID=UPI0015EC1F9E|nr:hypothetical protein [Stenotrophomonas maltophilia]
MNKEQEGQLIAWEAIARQALTYLSSEQKLELIRFVGPTCSRREPEVAAAATKVLQQVR